MNIIKNYPETMTKREMMAITEAVSTKKMKDIAGEIIVPDKWVMYEDLDPKTGELRTVLTVSENSEYFGTISKTFIKQFSKYTEELGEDLGAIKIVTGTSKNGREFVTCELA